ncbi:hypothetical protein OZN62_05455 [Aurantiacibacter sp. MUD11]|uniref:hypothetical protein n=1 Tax=Aurantiacibacter sp. MUD11 TaxID=3003265 RepID=UPI0022AB2061|nr:hypothetical protein [Aurantiacibacter sp. MUD11]WAT19013.1 hypothetical protein OZN62_05455 [Aurantiacibacter sp. MUD11]
MERPATPWHLWLIAILAVLFTLFGCYDYYMSQIGDREYIEAAVGGMGIDVDAAVVYFANFPLWMDLVWAIGVWGGLAGAALLLLRSRFAYPVWAVSLLALIVSNIYGFIEPIPGITDPRPTYMAIAMVFIIMLLLTLYARAMAKKGVLR